MTTKITSSPTFTPTSAAPAAPSTLPAPPEVADKKLQDAVADGWVDASDDSPGTFEWLGQQADRAIEDVSSGMDEVAEQARVTVGELLADVGTDLGPGAQLEPEGRRADGGRSLVRGAQEVVEELLWINDMSRSEVIEAGWETIGMPADRRAELVEAFDARADSAREMISDRVDAFTSRAREVAPRVIEAETQFLSEVSRRALTHTISPLFSELILDGMENPDGVVGIAHDIALFGLSHAMDVAKRTEEILPERHAVFDASKRLGQAFAELGEALDGQSAALLSPELSTIIDATGVSLVAAGTALEVAGGIPELLDDFIANEDNLRASVAAFDAAKTSGRIKSLEPNQQVGFDVKLAVPLEAGPSGSMAMKVTAKRNDNGTVRVRLDVDGAGKWTVGGKSDGGGAGVGVKLGEGKTVELELVDDAAVDEFMQLFQTQLVGGTRFDFDALEDGFNVVKNTTHKKGSVSTELGGKGVDSAAALNTSIEYGEVFEGGEAKLVIAQKSNVQIDVSVGSQGKVDVYLPDKERGLADVVEAAQAKGGLAALDALDDESISLLERVVGRDSKVSAKLSGGSKLSFKASRSGGVESITSELDASILVGKNTVKIKQKVTIDDPAKLADMLGKSASELHDELSKPGVDGQELLRLLTPEQKTDVSTIVLTVDLVVKDRVGIETKPFSSMVHMSETVPLYKSKNGEQQDVGVKNAPGKIRRAEDHLASELRPREKERSVPKQTNISAFLGGFRA